MYIFQNAGCDSPGLPYPPQSGSPLSNNSCGPVNPTLHEAQIARLAQAASELVANLPSFEPRKDAFANKRKMSKELEVGYRGKICLRPCKLFLTAPVTHPVIWAKSILHLITHTCTVD